MEEFGSRASDMRLDEISDLCELDLVPEEDVVVTMTSRDQALPPQAASTTFSPRRRRTSIVRSVWSSPTSKS